MLRLTHVRVYTKSKVINVYVNSMFFQRIKAAFTLGFQYICFLLTSFFCEELGSFQLMLVLTSSLGRFTCDIKWVFLVICVLECFLFLVSCFKAFIIVLIS